MIIEYKNIKMEYISEVEPTSEFSTGSIIARLDKENAQEIFKIINEIQTKTLDFIFLSGKPCHYKPGWYKADMQIKNEMYLGCRPSRITQVDEDNDNLFEVEIIYDRKKIN